MSSCLTGAGRAAYGLDLEMMIVKSPSSTSSSTLTSHSPTLSESGANSPFTISTRKPRTPRKRPNQTYNEAAALLSTAYPGIFSAKPCKFTKPPQQQQQQTIHPFFSGNSNSGESDLLFPNNPPAAAAATVSEKPRTFLLPNDPFRFDKMIPSSSIDEDFETESMLDGEIELGIDSIMGINKNAGAGYDDNNNVSGWCYGYPMGWGVERESSSSSNLEWVLGQRNGVRALRHAADDGDWWRYPRVDVTEISPKFSKIPAPPAGEKKKKNKVLSKINQLPPPLPLLPLLPPATEEERPNLMNNNHGLVLKLNHDKLLAAWSDRGSPFSDEPPGNESNLHARLAQIDLFSENNGGREASVLRYKEKRRSRLFFKKIRYEVRKVNADQRPRLKGRFVRRPGSPFNVDDEE
ncbi:protein CHLOROPLAST IMPORT APPARATUS 2-like isoform X2 [Impatiens glandulifera]|nr:protein CHLOROPLAST IMPORT APPARATUS 2-like isoform X2 [Impatiens glandulifera]